MVRTRDCDYCGTDIEPGTGTMLVHNNGSTTHFCSSKCENNADLGRESRNLGWTESGRRTTAKQDANTAAAAEAEAATEADENVAVEADAEEAAAADESGEADDTDRADAEDEDEDADADEGDDEEAEEAQA